MAVLQGERQSLVTLSSLENTKPSKPKSIWRTFKTYLPNTRSTVGLAVTLLVQGIVITALQTCIVGEWEPNLVESLHRKTHNVAAILPAQLATVAFESVYQVILCLDAIRLRNIVQIAGIALNNLAMLMFVIIGMHAIDLADQSLEQSGEPWIVQGTWRVVRSLYIALIALLAMGTALLIAFVWKLSREFAWYEYGCKMANQY